MESYIAKTLYGLEPVLVEELKALGAENVQPLSRAVAFDCDLKTMYKANMCLRTALRIIHPVAIEKVENADQLYAVTSKINWMRWFTVDQTYAVRAIARKNDNFKTPLFVALKTKDGIADQFRKYKGERPDIDKDNPDVEIHVHIYGTECTISIDTSGPSLHYRGYRKGGHAAPLNEVLAAGMVKLSGWDMKSPLVDFMCGSGTILTEAALMAGNKAPNLERKNFGVHRWKSFDKVLWSEARLELMAAEQPTTVKLYGSDNNRKAIAETRQNALRAGVEELLELHNFDFRDRPVPEEAGMLISNPPYGERIQTEDIDKLYSEIGDTLKKKYSGYQAWLLSSNIPATKRIGLRPYKKHILYNGKLECRFLGYELYKGSKE